VCVYIYIYRINPITRMTRRRAGPRSLTHGGDVPATLILYIYIYSSLLSVCGGGCVWGVGVLFLSCVCVGVLGGWGVVLVVCVCRCRGCCSLQLIFYSNGMQARSAGLTRPLTHRSDIPRRVDLNPNPNPPSKAPMCPLSYNIYIHILITLMQSPVVPTV